MPTIAKKQKLSSKPTTIRLGLPENAYWFLNQSLRHYRKTRRNLHEWSFALLHLTQSLELLLKHVLHAVHPILIYEDIDHPKHTVSLETALARMESLKIAVEEKERLNIRRAADHRNRIVHFEFELNRFECQNIYAQLFEFLHFFHSKHLRKELHAHIAKENWPIEAQLITYFKKNFITYNEHEMYNGNPKLIVRYQRMTHLLLKSGRPYARIAHGYEPGLTKALEPNYAETPCPDCGVLKGQLHVYGCEWEECPRRHHQLLGCGCSWTEALWVNR